MISVNYCQFFMLSLAYYKSIPISRNLSASSSLFPGTGGATTSSSSYSEVATTGVSLTPLDRVDRRLLAGNGYYYISKTVFVAGFNTNKSVRQYSIMHWLVDLQVHLKMCIRCYLRKQYQLYDTRCSNLALALDLSSAIS